MDLQQKKKKCHQTITFIKENLLTRERDWWIAENWMWQINKRKCLVRKSCRPLCTTKALFYRNHSGDILAAVSCGKGLDRVNSPLWELPETGFPYIILITCRFSNQQIMIQRAKRSRLGCKQITREDPKKEKGTFLGPVAAPQSALPM